MSAGCSTDRKPRLRLTERAHTFLCALWCALGCGLFATVTVLGPGHAVVSGVLIVVAIGTVCYVMWEGMRP